MRPHERRLFFRLLGLGALVTLLVASLQLIGSLASLDRLLYDLRARAFQFFASEPTDRIAVVHLDDQTFDAVGRFPWPRSILAGFVRELDRAQARVISLDIWFPEPQRPDVEVLEANGQPTPPRRPSPRAATDASSRTTPPSVSTSAPSTPTIRTIDHDARLAAAMRESGKVLTPINFGLRHQQRADPWHGPLVTALTEDLELEVETFLARAAQRRAAESDGAGSLDPREAQQIRAGFFTALSEAMYIRLHRWWERRSRSDANSNPDAVTFDQAVEALLPSEDPRVRNTPRQRRLRKAFDNVRAMKILRDKAAPVPDRRPGVAPFLRTATAYPPIPRFAQATATTGFVDYLYLGDGVLRSVPLFVEHHGRLFPQLPLMTLCALRGVAIEDVRFTDHSIEIPASEQHAPLSLPVRSQTPPGLERPVFGLFRVPWIGRHEQWRTMLDPDHERAEAQISGLAIWNILELNKKLASNMATADRAIRDVLSVLGASSLNEYETFYSRQFDAGRRENRAHGTQGARPRRLDEKSARHATPPQTPSAVTTRPAAPDAWPELREWVDLAIEQIEKSGFMSMLERVDAAQLSAEERRFAQAADALPLIRRETDRILTDLSEARSKLVEKVNGRAVLVGWTATGVETDFVASPLFSRCPGVMVFVASLSGMLSGEMWADLGDGWTLLMTLICGLTATLIVARFPAVWALIGVLALLGLVITINGLVLFDWANLHMPPAAAPVTVIAVWAGGTVLRLGVERAERARITKRFRSYVDPALVEYVIAHPDQARLDGEIREMTVAFSDLQGFTSLSERLKEQTVSLLSEYLGEVTPIIRAHQGYVNKFLGDGVMFFYGAPLHDNQHARHALLTAFEMQAALVAFNRKLTDRDLPNLKVRIGVSTGTMVVGDSGPEEASDYTVLGDNVNLAARLESANKATGTAMLATEATIRQAGADIVSRPIGRLLVVGKTTPVMVHEPLGLQEQVDATTLGLTQLTERVVESYVAGDLTRCRDALDELEAVGGEAQSTLAALYRTQIARVEAAPEERFDGTLVLEGK